MRSGIQPFAPHPTFHPRASPPSAACPTALDVLGGVIDGYIKTA